MRDDNFTKENNAKHMWHPMGHPADSLANPPKVIVSAQNSSITDIDGHTVVDAVGDTVAVKSSRNLIAFSSLARRTPRENGFWM